MGTCAVLLQSGLDKKWMADSMECRCYLRNIQDLLSDGKTPCERRFGITFISEHWSNITLFLRKTNRDFIHLVQKSCQVYSLDMCCPRGESGKETMVADVEKLEKMDPSELYARRRNAKGVLTSMKGENFIFPIADGTVKISGEDTDLTTSTLIRDRPDRGEEQDNLREESDGSSSTPRQDSSWYDGEAKKCFLSISGDFIHRHHVEPRIKLYVPTEKSFPIPQKYIDVARTSDRTLDVMSE